MKRLFYSFVRKNGNVAGTEELERKFHIKVWSKEMLIQTMGIQERMRIEFPGNLPPTNYKTIEYIIWRGEGSGDGLVGGNLL